MLKEIKYKKFNNYKPITLDGIYKGDLQTLSNLDFNINEIVNTEAPITLNTLKARLREAFNVKKISQKALDIIYDRIVKLGIICTDNLYDMVYWPESGVFKVEALRINSDRQIYDVPNQELKLLVAELNLTGEQLYRKILEYFGYEVLTEKARVYLEYIEGICKD